MVRDVLKKVRRNLTTKGVGRIGYRIPPGEDMWPTITLDQSEVRLGRSFKLRTRWPQTKTERMNLRHTRPRTENERDSDRGVSLSLLIPLWYNEHPNVIPIIGHYIKIIIYPMYYNIHLKTTSCSNNYNRQYWVRSIVIIISTNYDYN